MILFIKADKKQKDKIMRNTSAEWIEWANQEYFGIGDNSGNSGCGCGGCCIVGIIILGTLALVGCGGYKIAQSMIQPEKPKVEKAQITNNNAKYNKSTLFIKSLALNQKIKQA